MKKVKKYIHIIIAFFVGLIVSLVGTTYAASQIIASNVNFTPKDISWNVDNAEAAINDLYYKVPGIPTGTILSFMGTIAPTGYVICDGTEYNITSHTNLANFIKEQFGSYNYFGGDGETTFAVPDLRGEFLRGSGKTGGEVGLHQSDGLPDVTGNFLTGGLGSFMSGDGAFTYLGEVGRNVTAGSESRGGKLSFAASKSNSIYGAATEVRPKNTSVLYIIKY